MAAPIIAGIGMGASLLGAGASAIGGYGQAMSASRMAQYQAGISQLNTQIANQNAEYAFNAGQQRAAQAGMAARAGIGQTLARQGASNIAIGSGTSPDVVSGERRISQINTANIMNDAARVAYGYQTQAEEATAQGQVYQMAAQNEAEAAPINAAGSLLSGAGSVASKWLYGQDVGALPMLGA